MGRRRVKIREKKKVSRDDWSGWRKRTLTKFVLVFSLKTTFFFQSETKALGLAVQPGFKYVRWAAFSILRPSNFSNRHMILKEILYIHFDGIKKNNNNIQTWCHTI